MSTSRLPEASAGLVSHSRCLWCFSIAPVSSAAATATWLAELQGCSHPPLPWALQGPGKAHIPRGSLSKQGTPRLLFILSCNTVSPHLLLSLLFCFTQLKVEVPSWDGTYVKETMKLLSPTWNKMLMTTVYTTALCFVSSLFKFFILPSKPLQHSEFHISSFHAD